MKVFNVGIIGLGTVARVHVRVLSSIPNVRIKAVCDVKDAAKIDVPSGATLYTDYIKMLDEEKLDAVHICLPHYLHYPVAVECARRRIPTLLEKPVVMNGKEVDALTSIIRENDALVAVCLQNRLNNTFIRLRECLADPSVGKVTGIKGVALWSRKKEYYEAAPWRGQFEKAGGGCLINQAVHTLDQMMLLGGDIRCVKATISNLTDLDITVEDSAMIRLEFASGAVGLLMASNSNANNSSIEVEVVTENAVFRIKDFVLSRADKTNEYSFTPICRDEILEGSKSYYGVGHQNLIRNFYRYLSGETGIGYTTVAEAGKVIRLLDKVRLSSEKGESINWEE